MDWPYIHTLVNHFPIVLSVVGAAVVVAALGSRSRALWLYAVVTVTLAGLSVYPVFWSGNQAEEPMEHRWYTVRSSIHAHEESSELALWIVLAAGLIAAYAWWRAAKRDRTGPAPAWLRVLVLVGSLASVGALAYTALLGGRIVHESPNLAAPGPQSSPSPTAGSSPAPVAGRSSATSPPAP